MPCVSASEEKLALRSREHADRTLDIESSKRLLLTRVVQGFDGSTREQYFVSGMALSRQT